MGEDSYTAFWKGYRIAKENEKSKRDAERVAMNKQQLIDKAIDELGDDYPKIDYKYLHKAGCTYFSCDVERPSVSSETCICTRQEFEARKAERESTSHWFDYENQKALRLPPVGEVFESYWHNDTNPKWNECRIAYISEEHAILRYSDGEENYYETSVMHKKAKFRPLDWDKKKSDDMLKIAEIVCEYGSSVGCIEVAKAILAAGYRKCHNKTPSDKE